MKIGWSTLGNPDWTLEQVAQAAKDYGYDGIELRILDGEVITPELVRKNLDRLRKVFGKGGPELIGLGSSVRLALPDPAEHARQEAALVEFVGLARELGVPFVRVFGGQRPEGDSDIAAAARVGESLRKVAPLAESAGVTVALETHDSFSKSALVARALAGAPSKNVGALWDTHHPHRMGEAVAEVWTNLSDRLVHVHLKDARLRSDGGWDLVLLGEGEVACREILRALALRGYAGYVVMEWEKKWHPEIAAPEVAMPQHLARAREWLADVE
ncbi:MAG TPA: sugar phosphate isomerase/epimerase family protein [Chloroflexota bacterium]|nr:sugar phosphate isomerase/epimerase family protein [Chloroflexota bacterium]